MVEFFLSPAYRKMTFCIDMFLILLLVSMWLINGFSRFNWLNIWLVTAFVLALWNTTTYYAKVYDLRVTARVQPH